MEFAYPITMVRLRRGLVPDPTTPGGTRLAGWPDAARTDLPGCALAPAGSAALDDPVRQAVTTDTQVLGPIDMDLRPGDRVQDPYGDVWDVETHPARYRSPFTGWEAGAVVTVTTAEG